MKKVLGWSATVLASILVALLSCHAADPLKIGVVIPLTGDRARVGELQRNSFILAMDEINQRRAVSVARTVSVIIEDDNDQPDLARSAAEKVDSGGRSSRFDRLHPVRIRVGNCRCCREKKGPIPHHIVFCRRTHRAGLEICVSHLSACERIFQGGPIFLGNQVVKPLTLAVVYDNTSFGRNMRRNS